MPTGADPEIHHQLRLDREREGAYGAYLAEHFPRVWKDAVDCHESHA